MDNLTIEPVNSCVFCRQEIHEKSFCASAHFIAFYNIAPILPGHSLIIPKAHFGSLLELPDDALSEMMIFARRVTQILITVFQCDGFDWSVQDGISAGQTVAHLHMHIIPRKPADMPEGNEWYGKIARTGEKVLDSQHRDRLSNVDYDAITARLTYASKSINV